MQAPHAQPMHQQTMHHAAIRSVQHKLNQLGYRAGPVDGIMGPQTHAAISA
jgi:peptidoglycan hydrolase-like protein with peptidoglycan-binding domain